MCDVICISALQRPALPSNRIAREATADAKRLAMRAQQRHDGKRGLRLGPPLRWPDGSLGARMPSTGVRDTGEARHAVYRDTRDVRDVTGT
jgi:hypothetical protein